MLIHGTRWQHGHDALAHRMPVLDLSAAATLAYHSHEKISEAIVEPPDVREHAHGRMVLTWARAPIHELKSKTWYCGVALARDCWQWLRTPSQVKETICFV